MNRWLRQIKLEAKQLTSLPLSLLFLLPLLYGLWFAYNLSAIAPPASENLYTFAYQFQKVQFVLSLGVAIMLGILLIRIDYHRPGYSWMNSMPISAWTRITAKFTVGFVYLSLFTLAMAIVFVYFGFSRELPPIVIWEYMWLFALQYEWSYAITLALSMFLGAFISNRISYLIGFCVWLFGTFFLDLFIINRYALYPLTAFHLSQFLTDSILESEVWGHTLINNELWLAKGFVLAFTLLLLILVVTYLTMLRPTGRKKVWLGMSTAAMIVSILCFIPYGQLWVNRYDEYAVIKKDALTYEEQFLGEEPWQFHINDYRLSVTRRPNNEISVEAVLTIPNFVKNSSGSSLPLMLNRKMEVTEARWNSQPVEWKRSGDQLILEAAEPDYSLTAQTLELSYNGPLYEWLLLSNRPSIPVFLYGQQAFLPAYSAWYPLPGNPYRYYKGMDGKLYLNTDAGLPGKASFHVEFLGFEQKLHATLPSVHSGLGMQLFEAEQADGITALSGGFIEVTLPGEALKIVTTPSNKLEAERFLYYLSKHLNYYRSWLEDPPRHLEQVLYLSLINQGYNGGSARLTGNSLMLAETLTHNLDNYQIGKTVHAFLFGDLYTSFAMESEEDKPYSMVGLIRNAFYYLYLREEMQLTHEQIAKGSTLGVYPLLSLNSGTDVYQMIDQAIADGQIERVKKLLNHYYSQGLTIDLAPSGSGIPMITEEDWLDNWKRVVELKE
ncbi:ABC transporter permease [Paenibacillus sp. J2TS4]|uniref:ABC transporter permease n=1 Tax=Paenibacillus sp. J2TS4 TaxID=2807194 RepID=UPI001B19D65A|nr:hypothetical protein [Paenibacillus sp. J2TS4]GIP35494.1 hypothetical protein J2TS4_47040 [Paenibacillus sp. J2TS4]